MRGSLQHQVAWDAEHLLCDATDPNNGFSEAVEFLAAGSFAARPIQVVIEPEQSTQQDPVGDEEKQERIRVFCLRDANKGIAAPQLQDQLTRANESRPYVFSGQISETNQAAWVLIYWRFLRTGRGPRS